MRDPARWKSIKRFHPIRKRGNTWKKWARNTPPRRQPRRWIRRPGVRCPRKPTPLRSRKGIHVSSGLSIKMADCISKPRRNPASPSAAPRPAVASRQDRRPPSLCGGYLRAQSFALLAAVASVSSAASPTPAKVKEVRFWSLGEVTRVAIEVSADFRYRYDRISTPDRIFFDIEGARPQMTDRKIFAIPVGDSLLKQIRVAETQPGVTRIVLDLEAH